MNTEELRPLLSDLKLVAVAFDATGETRLRFCGPVVQGAVSREGRSGDRSYARRLDSRERVIFGIEEFGYSR